MSERKIIEAQIAKKIHEVAILEEKLKAARVYVRALEDVVKMIDRETPRGTSAAQPDGDVNLRRGSLVAQARKVILARAAPIHVDELLGVLGRDVTRETKASLTSSLAAYVRKGEIFTRPAPSTFGLIELDHYSLEESKDEPPVGFGSVASKTEDDEIPF